MRLFLLVVFCLCEAIPRVPQTRGRLLRVESPSRPVVPPLPMYPSKNVQPTQSPSVEEDSPVSARTLMLSEMANQIDKSEIDIDDHIAQESRSPSRQPSDSHCNSGLVLEESPLHKSSPRRTSAHPPYRTQPPRTYPFPSAARAHSPGPTSARADCDEECSAGNFSPVGRAMSATLPRWVTYGIEFLRCDYGGDDAQQPVLDRKLRVVCGIQKTMIDRFPTGMMHFVVDPRTDESLQIDVLQDGSSNMHKTVPLLSGSFHLAELFSSRPEAQASGASLLVDLELRPLSVVGSTPGVNKGWHSGVQTASLHLRVCELQSNAAVRIFLRIYW